MENKNVSVQTLVTLRDEAQASAKWWEERKAVEKHPDLIAIAVKRNAEFEAKAERFSALLGFYNG